MLDGQVKILNTAARSDPLFQEVIDLNPGVYFNLSLSASITEDGSLYYFTQS